VQVQQLQMEASEARGQLTSVTKAHDQLRAEMDKRVAAANQSATAERDALQARHTMKVKKLQEAAKDQVSLWDGVCKTWRM
jgi:F0F1-type ATP synthase membrane subunit b/b'